MSKLTAFPVVCAVVGGLGVFAPWLSEARAEGEIKYANVEQVLKDSQAGKSLAGQISDRRQQIIERREEEQKALSGERDGLLEQRAVLSEDAFEKKQESFLKKVQEIQQGLLQEEEALRKDVERAYASINAILDQILLEILKDQDLGYIGSRKSFLAVRPEDDVTPIVISLLNQRLPRVTLAGGSRKTSQ